MSLETGAEASDQRDEAAHLLRLQRLEQLALERQAAGGEEAAGLLLERGDALDGRRADAARTAR